MEQTFSTLASVVQTQYELHLHEMQRSAVGVGSETWFLRCEEGDYVIKFPAASRINHPEAEPELCAFLRMHGIPACDFLKKRREAISHGMPTGAYLLYSGAFRM